MQKTTIALIAAAVVVVGGGAALWARPHHHPVAALIHVKPTSTKTTSVTPSSPQAPPSTSAPSPRTSSPTTRVSHSAAPVVHHTTSPTPVSHSTAPTPSHSTQPPASTSTSTSTTPTSTAPKSTTSTQPTAQQYPSLATSVASKPVATTSQIQAALSAPATLGELNWNTADANTVVQALGSKTAPQSTTNTYAETYLYAMLGLNASAFNSSPYDAGAAMQLQGAPSNVSRVDQITLTKVQPGFASVEYYYTVVFTTTSGTTETNQCAVNFTPNPSDTSQWILNAVADLTTE